MSAKQNLDPNQPPTHIAVPIALFQKIRKIIGGLPLDDVLEVAMEMQNCQTLAIPTDTQPGNLLSTQPQDSGGNGKPDHPRG